MPGTSPGLTESGRKGLGSIGCFLSETVKDAPKAGVSKGGRDLL